MRVFISIDMPLEMKEKIKNIQDSLPNFFGKRTELENLHLTLKFLGEINEDKLRQIKEKLREIRFKKFESSISSIGVFSEKFVRIVWLHLTNCNNLQRRIDEKLKDLFKPEDRFMSHLTIARVKAIKNKQKFLDELKKVEIPKIKFEVDKFKLKKSMLSPEGPSYKTLEEYVLD